MKDFVRLKTLTTLDILTLRVQQRYCDLCSTVTEDPNEWAVVHMPHAYQFNCICNDCIAAIKARLRETEETR